MDREERRLAALERISNRMIYQSHMAYLAWLEHHYPEVRRLDHKAAVDFEARRAALSEAEGGGNG